MEVLKPYGFERYHLEDRSLAENVRLFNSADMVIGPHGAGLTDIIFTEDCTLVELFGARLNKVYEKLSKTLEIEYNPMYCQSEGADIIVDTAALEEQMNTIT
ncbi:capsular polysaccharide biosynthesis protein-like protein [Halorubrum kocurii JCM 14978]|uniref:Capsular polysaccharide biosynthesis protein-like protein n=2 Tax=Halorubrum kocurii TaxID=478441 RepID=M0NI82_9EURY|nr:capsular polysaccharide biosynthesis protein-like protein [Halorubrum kocurii JCM 14978]